MEGGADTLFCADKQVDHLPRSVFLTFNKEKLIAKERFIPVQIKKEYQEHVLLINDSQCVLTFNPSLSRKLFCTIKILYIIDFCSGSSTYKNYRSAAYILDVENSVCFIYMTVVLSILVG